MTDENKQMMNLDQPKPHDENAERIVISQVLKGVIRETIIQALHGIDKPFYNPTHQKIYKLALEWVNSSETTSFRDYIREHSLFNECGGVKYLKELLSIKPSSDFTDALVSVKKTAKLRNIISLCTETIQCAYNEENEYSLIKYLIHEANEINMINRNICLNCKYAGFIGDGRNVSCMRHAPTSPEGDDANFPVVGFEDVCGDFVNKNHE